MNKDILKEFVDRNRSGFDDASPSADVFAKIQAQIATPAAKAEAEPKNGGKIVRFRYWWAAAAMLLVVLGTVFFLQRNGQVNAPQVAKTKPVQPIPAPGSNDTGKAVTAPLLAGLRNTQKINAKSGKGAHVRSLRKKVTDNLAVTSTGSQWADRLGDSTSAADRLGAVLAMGKESHLNNADLEQLANTMNKDENSNVRLAALDALSGQPDKAKIKGLILSSITKQDDPIVLMELLSQLSPSEAKTAQKQLLEISQNPLNIDAVRDQAFVALLRSKSNF